MGVELAAVSKDLVEANPVSSVNARRPGRQGPEGVEVIKAVLEGGQLRREPCPGAERCARRISSRERRLSVVLPRLPT